VASETCSAETLQAEVTAFQEECSADLAQAEPIIKEAEAALNSLDKASLGELKSFSNPAAEVVQVLSACMVLRAPGGKVPKVSLWCFLFHRPRSPHVRVAWRLF
jgi:dynein heavy chain, axonemal